MIRKGDVDRVIGAIPALENLEAVEWGEARLVKVDSTTPHSVGAGRKLQHVIFVLSGSIRVYKIGQSGREITLYRVQSGECCVLMIASILGEIEYEASVDIERETEVVIFPVGAFKEWMNRYPAIRQMVYRQFILKWNRVANLLEQVTFDSVPERLSNFLIQRKRETSSSTILTITHEELAVELGSSREVMSRILKDFVDKGAISLQRGKIILLDLSKLEN